VKIIVLLISLAVLIPGLATASTVSIQDKQIIQTEEETTTQTFTIYRYGADGSVTPIDIDLEIDEEDDIGKVLADKCEELLNNDKEMQNFSLKALKIGFASKVKSWGRGFHYKMKLIGKLAVRFILIRLGMPFLQTMLTNPLVVCKYKNDEKAGTEITSIILNRTQNISGNHTVIVRNFIGYTTWFGRVSFSPLDIIPRAFSGWAKLAICIKN